MTTKLLSSAEAAEQLGICTRTLARHVALGEIAYIRMGTGLQKPRRMFHPDDLTAFVEDRRKRGCPPTDQRAGRTISMTSPYEVIDFTALRAARAKERRMRSRKPSERGAKKR
ncbi:helix-turn-helix domain-containing protein [Methylobacterium aquaticum]|uniref:helix-turn-helix domain-containing protein n=1 Tax=Methylobacterium aquaticum TaxID=270351 RepID=UPI003D1808DF